MFRVRGVCGVVVRASGARAVLRAAAVGVTVARRGAADNADVQQLADVEVRRREYHD